MMNTPEKHLALLSDLGRPTMRGVRKCSACGTYNGTRGLSCKNKNCNQIFKEKERKRGHSANCVKIITGSSIKVYSVRLRDRGPDYRGFVQLPLVQDEQGNFTNSCDPEILASASRCYVDTCSRNTHDVDIKSECCSHIKLALQASQDATPLTLKNSVLNSLQVSNETKQAIWLLATETSGPLVQRITKHIMVVKCKPTVKQPLGFLHFAFFETTRNRSKSEHKFHCSCRQFKQVPQSWRQELLLRRCVHFYACICAFGSDEKLEKEFRYYIDLDANFGGPQVQHTHGIPDLLTTQIVKFDEHSNEDTAVIEINGETIRVSALPIVENSSGSVEVVIGDDGGFFMSPASPEYNQVKQDEGVVQASNALLTLQENFNTPKKCCPTEPQKNALKKIGVLNENNVSINFHTWLASVTERINQTMHYQFSGMPDPLVFHTHQPFFDCLQQRISHGFRKRRLPNSTAAFIRRDALPLGMFTKNTWHITNILHVKQIFDTEQMPLDITRSFVENADGTFDNYELPAVTSSLEGNNVVKRLPIRPFELKTYLKVGNTSPNQQGATPFIIEWIPDILPTMHIGELRIKFEYGHQRNGSIENRSMSITPLGCVAKDASHPVLMSSTDDIINVQLG